MILASLAAHHAAPAPSPAGAALSLPDLATVLDGLAGLVLTEPSPQTLEQADTFFQALPEPLSRETPPAVVDPATVREDYLALLLVSSSGRYTPPYASIWLEGRFNAGSTRVVQALYADTGFDPLQLPMSAHWRNPFLPDHIGFELAFTAGLLYSAQNAANDEALVATAREWAEQHLTRWVPAFSRALAQHAETPFFRSWARCLEILCCDCSD